jgi:NADPH:quinone reductase
MRAILALHPGPPEVLGAVTLPDPKPAAGQVRVAVEAAAITFVDTMMRAGSPISRSVKFPVVLGNGVGGVVDDVGEGVERGWMGARVIGTTGGTGGYASAALVGVADLHRVPDGLGLREATALLADGRTAVGLHEAARIREGETVVVVPAAGGVGGLLVQLASRSGARVIALAGSQAKLDHARALGADAALNSREEDWLVQLDAAAPGGVDVAFDGVGGDVTVGLVPRLHDGARLLPHGAAGGRRAALDDGMFEGRAVTVIPLDAIGTTPEQLFALVERALGLAVRGELRPVIGQTFALDQAAEAHAAIAARATIGKTLLLP